MSPLQRKVLDALRRLTTAHGVSPSLSELAEAVGLGVGKTGVHRVLLQLRREGYVYWSPYHARSITLLADAPAYTRPVLEALPTERLTALYIAAQSVLRERIGSTP